MQLPALQLSELQLLELQLLELQLPVLQLPTHKSKKRPYFSDLKRIFENRALFYLYIV
ncbi:hypothetical protein D3C74_329620 [compost metagenome]